MAPSKFPRKRKEISEIAPPPDELDDVQLDGVLSQSEDDSDFDSSDAEANEFRSDDSADPSDDEDEVHSQDIPSEHGDDLASKEVIDNEDDDAPNYRVVTDANGAVRYEYDEIDPVYDSDDSDAQEATNTIGNIPLSFYDSYPHIGYDINGKKIMRPATGDALDALLDTIEVPKGWTGLTDPETGKPLNLSQDELELLRRLQMGEVPEDGYDPYPVCSSPTKIIGPVANKCRIWYLISQVSRRRCPSVLRLNLSDDSFLLSTRPSAWPSLSAPSRRVGFCLTSHLRSDSVKKTRKRKLTMTFGPMRKPRILMS